MPGKGQEITVHLFDCRGQVRHGLGTIDQKQCPGRVGELADLAHRVHRTQHVGDVRQADQLGALGKRPFQFLQVQRTLIVDVEELEHDPLAIPNHLPGHQVGMVLGHGEQHLISRGKAHLVAPSAQQRIGDQVDPLCAVAHKDDLSLIFGADKASHVLMGLQVKVGRLLSEQVGRAVDVPVIGLVEGTEGIEHLAWLLCGRCVVQVDQLSSADLPPQDREILSDTPYVHRLLYQCLIHALVTARRSGHRASGPTQDRNTL